MLSSIKLEDFKAMPYLAKTPLMLNNSQRITFAPDRPNVIVGPIGSGKSALLEALALRYLAYFLPVTTFSAEYVLAAERKSWWKNDGPSWNPSFAFLPGLITEGMPGTCLYYHPDYIPGRQATASHAMMLGYTHAAKEYAEQSRNRSAGQKNYALLKKAIDVLSSRELLVGLNYKDWLYGTKPGQFKAVGGPGQLPVECIQKADVLLKLVAPAVDDKPLLLLDNPERALDARSELTLWRHIEMADCQSMQIVVATHSIYPLMRPDLFNIIEAVPGYCASVLADLELAY